MALAPGTRLGPYEIQTPLGAGGMGEVYSARDTRLGRDVAVKVLPQHVSASPEDRARFRREAKTISGLNHPHICVLHDIGQEGDTDFLVMELVEGETLSQRLTRGPMATSDVLKVGAQIADALDRAHRAGVTHRDLKPGNVMLTRSGAKLMDFGLARSSRGGELGGESDVTATAPGGTPKSNEPITAKGTIVGTYQYMAPEQLEGKAADARSDVWALGCVLYEMATGKRAFDGSTPASLISAIMRDHPRVMSELAPMAPPALERLVLACLEKDPDERIQTAHDLKLQLRWIAEAGSQVVAATTAGRGSRERVAWALAGVAALTAAGLAVVLLQPKARTSSAMFEIQPPSEVFSMGMSRVSPDGRYVAFNATDSAGVTGIWVRPMDTLESRRLPGTEGTSLNSTTRPFWSPDSRLIAFFTGGKLFKISVTGGQRVKICEAPTGADGTWSSRGIILFDGGERDSIQAVPASGGLPVGATAIDRKEHEIATSWPQFLPDGRHFLYTASCSKPGGDAIKVGSIDSKKTVSLGPTDSRVEYGSGHILYERDGALLARPFDPGSQKFRGNPFAVVEKVDAGQLGLARFSVSTVGTLVYQAASAGGSRRLVWTDRSGKRIGSLGVRVTYANPALSPDGTRLAITVYNPARNAGDIWIWDLARDIGSRLTFSSGDVYSATWSPDGERVVYDVHRNNAYELHSIRVAGAGADSVLLTSDSQVIPGSWSSDGRWMTYMSAVGSHYDVYALAMRGPSRSLPLVVTRFNEGSEVLSPDGKWLAYISNESGQFEIYVQSFPNPDRKVRVSSAGGADITWRGDSRELYYVSLERRLMAVTVGSGASPGFSHPRELFAAPLGVPGGDRNRCAVSRDGQRFLFAAPEREGNSGVTTVVQDWLGRSRQR
jgi:eukaryotic-like serine/threonine-protein kinase